MEGRGGAKGNAVRGSTCQTQSWESVSLALGRIRETARREKRVRFTALLHHVTVDLLHWSFSQLERHAAAGVDGVTWDQYEDGLESNLIDRGGPGCLNRFSASISGASAKVRLPSGVAAG